MTDKVRELLSRCEDEFDSDSGAAWLRSLFSAAMTVEAFRSGVAADGVECLAFVLGAFDAAQHSDWAWPDDALLNVGVLAAHHGRQEEAAAIAEVCIKRIPENTECVALWAETALTAHETIDRYLSALARASDRHAVEVAARHFAAHSEKAADLLRQLAKGLASAP